MAHFNDVNICCTLSQHFTLHTYNLLIIYHSIINLLPRVLATTKEACLGVNPPPELTFFHLKNADERRLPFIACC